MRPRIIQVIAAGSTPGPDGSQFVPSVTTRRAVILTLMVLGSLVAPVSFSPVETAAATIEITRLDVPSSAIDGETVDVSAEAFSDESLDNEMVLEVFWWDPAESPGATVHTVCEDSVDLRMSGTKTVSCGGDFSMPATNVTVTATLRFATGGGIDRVDTNVDLIDGEIVDFDSPTGEYHRGETVPADVAVRNTGTTVHTFYVGYGVRDSNGEDYDNDGTTHVPVTLSPDERATVSVEWDSSEGPLDTYDAGTALWEREDGGKLYGRLDDRWVGDAFELRPNIDAEITGFDAPSGEYSRGDLISATVTVENTGSVEHTFYVGYGARDSNGEGYDNDGTTHVPVTLAPGETQAVTVEWDSSEGPLDTYDIGTAVWGREEGDLLRGRLDERWIENAFELRSNVDAEITGFDAPSGEHSRGDLISATVSFRNTGSVEHTFYVGYGARDSNGEDYDNDGTTHVPVSLAPGETKTVTVEWDSAEGPLDTYDAGTAVWEGIEGDRLVGKFDERWADDAFELIDRVESNGITIEDVAANRVPVWVSEHRIYSGMGTSGLFHGADQGLVTYVQLDQQGEGDSTIRTKWVLVDPTGTKYLSGTSKRLKISQGTNTIKIPIPGGDRTLHQDVTPGEYTLQISVERRTSVFPQDFEHIGDVTLAIHVSPTEEPPDVFDVPTGDFDADPEPEPFIGRPYTYYRPSDTSPWWDTARAVMAAINIIAIVMQAVVPIPGPAHVCCVFDLPSQDNPVSEVYESARQTAQIYHDDAGPGRFELYWRNSNWNRQYFEASYDRAVVSATIPDAVEIVDDGGADYVIHDAENDSYQLLWIETAVEKGIDPRSPLDEPNERYVVELQSPRSSPETVEVEYSLQLQFGPLKELTRQPEPFVSDQPVGALKSVYVYRQWQNEPWSVKWMAVGLDDRSPTVSVTAPPGDTDPVQATSLPSLVMAGFWSFDDSDAPGTDQSGNGHAGQLSGDPELIEGVSGTALRFDGEDDFVMVPMTESLQPTGSFTLSMWVRPTEATAADGQSTALGLYTYNGNGRGEGVRINVHRSRVNYQARHSDGFGQPGGGAQNDPYYHVPGDPVPLATGEWHHVALRYDADAETIALLVNGTEASSLDAPKPPRVDDTYLLIGARPASDGGDYPDQLALSHFAGDIDEVRIYHRALGDSAVAGLAEPTRPAPTATPPGPTTTPPGDAPETPTRTAPPTPTRPAVTTAGGAVPGEVPVDEGDVEAVEDRAVELPGFTPVTAVVALVVAVVLFRRRP